MFQQREVSAEIDQFAIKREIPFEYQSNGETHFRAVPVMNNWFVPNFILAAPSYHLLCGEGVLQQLETSQSRPRQDQDQ